jgi:hypothetical protein
VERGGVSVLTNKRASKAELGDTVRKRVKLVRGARRPQVEEK